MKGSLNNAASVAPSLGLVGAPRESRDHPRNGFPTRIGVQTPLGGAQLWPARRRGPQGPTGGAWIGTLGAGEAFRGATLQSWTKARRPGRSSWACTTPGRGGFANICVEEGGIPGTLVAVIRALRGVPLAGGSPVSRAFQGNGPWSDSHPR